MKRNEPIGPGEIAEAPALGPGIVIPRPSAPDPAALPEFLASVAHALRSPLGVVSGALAELRAELTAASSADDHALVALADRGIRRLGDIADTMSLAAALDSGTLELRLAPVDLVALLRGAAAMAATLERRREVEITCDLPADPCPARADEDRLSRAVSEVVINAIRHAVRHVRVGLELTAGEARVTIEDDGRGVAADRESTLFRRFAPRPSPSGLGMGLSIAHDLIEAHGGRIVHDASALTPGRPGTLGARFVITLPIDHGA